MRERCTKCGRDRPNYIADPTCPSGNGTYNGNGYCVWVDVTMRTTTKDLAAVARRVHDPAFSAILDYVDAVREQVEASAMRDGAAGALELIAQEVSEAAGCLDMLDGERFARLLKNRVAFYEELAKQDEYTIGEFADHAARHRGAAKAVEAMRVEFSKAGFMSEFYPKKVVRGFREAASKIRTGQRKVK